MPHALSTLHSLVRGSALLGVMLCPPASAQDLERGMDAVAEQIIALERSALDRWSRADPQGYVDLYADDVTYFDPTLPRRVDGLEALEATLEPLDDAQRPFGELRYEMLDPQVQRQGDVAVLTFNLVNYAKPEDGPEFILARWNATKVYRRESAGWRIIHSHWSYTQPEIADTSGTE